MPELESRSEFPSKRKKNNRRKYAGIFGAGCIIDFWSRARSKLFPTGHADRSPALPGSYIAGMAGWEYLGAGSDLDGVSLAGIEIINGGSFYGTIIFFTGRPGVL